MYDKLFPQTREIWKKYFFFANDKITNISPQIEKKFNKQKLFQEYLVYFVDL